jgi:hypothetical protein
VNGAQDAAPLPATGGIGRRNIAMALLVEINTQPGCALNAPLAVESDANFASNLLAIMADGGHSGKSKESIPAIGKKRRSPIIV